MFIRFVTFYFTHFTISILLKFQLNILIKLTNSLAIITVIIKDNKILNINCNSNKKFENLKIYKYQRFKNYNSFN